MSKRQEADGYDVSVAGDILDEKGLVLTYKHIPAVVNVSARVSWNDANNQDGIRPTDTLVQLYADGTALGDKAVIAVSYTHLDVYKRQCRGCQ